MSPQTFVQMLTICLIHKRVFDFPPAFHNIAKYVPFVESRIYIFDMLIKHLYFR